MHNPTPEQFNILKSLKLSSIEKIEIRDSLTHFMASHPITHPVKKIWFTQGPLTVSPYGGISMNLTKILVFSFIGIIFAGGTLTFASGNAIPGEILYPIKINIKEEIEGSLKTAPAEKLAWKEQKVSRRIEEIKTLTAKKQVTKREVVIAQAVLKKHVAELNETFNELKSENQGAILATTAQLIPKSEATLETTTQPVVALVAEQTTTDTPIEKKDTDKPTVETEINLDTIDDTDTAKLKNVLTQEVINQIQNIKESAENATEDEPEKNVDSEKEKTTIETTDSSKSIPTNMLPGAVLPTITIEKHVERVDPETVDAPLKKQTSPKLK